MAEVNKQISRFEYLQKYITGDKDKKKLKKKKSKVPTKKALGLKIIDNDIDMKALDFKDDVEDECGEEAPVVAEVIDERPKEIQLKEQYNSANWKKFGNTDDDDDDESSGRHESTENFHKGRHDSDDNSSPHHSSNSHEHHSENIKGIISDEDLSPQRNNKSIEKVRHDSDSDLSPSRKKSSPSKSEEKKQKSYSASGNSSLHANKYSNNKTTSHVHSDSDLSPERTTRNMDDVKNKRRFKETSKQSRMQDSDSDFSPPRKTDRASYASNSSPRMSNDSKKASKRVLRRDSDSDISPPRKANRSNDSPDSQRPSGKSSHASSSQKLLTSGGKLDEKNRPVKTLSGLKAGLQKASTLRAEINELRKREDKNINEMDDDLSGRNAKTIYRDRGRKRNMEEELRQKQEMDKKLAEKQEKYSNWGKGLEQKEQQMKRFENDAYEMTKPLARYKDDEDLDKILRQEMREEDPMFNYMQKKKTKQQNIPELPKYNGPPPPPNRFNIQPGYRWDGVDRSNGFEKRYFEKVNATKSKETESHLWSVQDM